MSSRNIRFVAAFFCRLLFCKQKRSVLTQKEAKNLTTFVPHSALSYLALATSFTFNGLPTYMLQPIPQSRWRDLRLYADSVLRGLLQYEYIEVCAQ